MERSKEVTYVYAYVYRYIYTCKDKSSSVGVFLSLSFGREVIIKNIPPRFGSLEDNLVWE